MSKRCSAVQMDINLRMFRANLLPPSLHLGPKDQGNRLSLKLRQIATTVRTVTCCKEAICLVTALTIANLLDWKNLYCMVDSKTNLKWGPRFDPGIIGEQRSVRRCDVCVRNFKILVHPAGGRPLGCNPIPPRPAKEKFKNKEYVNTKTSNDVRDWRFGQNQPPKSSDDLYPGMLKYTTQSY